jgi:N-acetylneuraminic acid mutarotase
MLQKSAGNSRPKTDSAHLLLCSAALLGLLQSTTATAAITLPALPEAVSNQLVLQSTVRGKWVLASFAGQSAQTGVDHNKVWQLTEGSPMWQAVPALPNQARQSGRLAASGVAMSNHLFIFAGADVAADGSDKILTDSYRFSPLTQTYTKLPDMPVAVADSLALAYQERYIYLVSGRQQYGPVNLVQLFDNFSQKWLQATPYPGAAVAGHAGAIVGNKLLVCDGISMDYQQQTTGQSRATAACYLGDIDPKHASLIRWQKIPHHGGAARYRQAAIPLTHNGEAMIAFVGGTEPTAISSLTTAQVDAKASDKLYLYALQQQRWLTASSTVAVADLRSLVSINSEIYSVGGMDNSNNVNSALIKHQIKLLPE